MASLEGQAADSQEILQEETRQKLAAQSRVRQLEEAMEAAQDQLEEEEEARRALENKITHLNASVQEYKKRLDDDNSAMDSLEEVKKKLLRDLEAAQTRVEAFKCSSGKPKVSSDVPGKETKEVRPEFSGRKGHL